MCKHFFRITGSEDYFLEGTIFFKCDHCGMRVGVDRLSFHLALMGRPIYRWQ